MPEQTSALWPLGLYCLAVVAITTVILGISHVLGERHSEKGTAIPYESGMTPTGSAQLRFSADFYLVAMFFVIFDLESIFVFAWAVAARDVGWSGYTELFVFVGILLAALAYLWRSGALTWGTGGQAHAPRPGKEIEP